MDQKVKKWVAGIGILACIASWFHQTAYTGLVSSLQSKWQYLCSIIPGADQFLGPIESTICEKFIPALLQVSEPFNEALGQLLSRRVKSGWITSHNPIVSALHLHQCLVASCNILVKALQDGGGLNAKAHKGTVKGAGNEARKVILKNEQDTLDGLKGSGGRKFAKRLERMGKTGA